jgi:hypothetical protein
MDCQTVASYVARRNCPHRAALSGLRSQSLYAVFDHFAEYTGLGWTARRRQYESANSRLSSSIGRRSWGTGDRMDNWFGQRMGPVMLNSRSQNTPSVCAGQHVEGRGTSPASSASRFAVPGSGLDAGAVRHRGGIEGLAPPASVLAQRRGTSRGCGTAPAARGGAPLRLPPWPELGAPISPAVFGFGRTMENALAGHWAYLARLHVRQCQRI